MTFTAGAWLLLAAAASAQPPAVPAGPPAAETRQRESGEIQIGAKEIARLFRGLSGIPMWALVGCCVLTVMFAAERLVVLQRRRVAPPAFTQRLLAHLRDEPMNAALVQELQAACLRDGSPAAHLLKTVIENHGRSALEIRTAVSDVADMELFHLRSHVRALAGLSATAPLLGLFGTVIGMIEAFQALSETTGSSKTEMLAAGIGLALVATAGGLGVAILGSVAYYYLQGRVELRIHELDQLVNQAVLLVASDTAKEPRQGRAGQESLKVKHAAG